MKRIIYSFYIDIPKDELDIFDKNILIPNKSVPINYVTKDAFKENYTKLVACKRWYAKQLGVDFKMFEYDICLLYTSPSPRDTALSRMPSSA